jgi:hypothetical protein
MGMDCPCLGDLVLPSSCCVGVAVVSCAQYGGAAANSSVERNKQQESDEVTLFVRRESDLSSFRTMTR